MIAVRRIRLDVLKPHHPNALEFAQALAETGNDYRIRLMVLEVDEHTETLQIVVEGQSINFTDIQETISNLGASLHSIDEVEVASDGIETSADGADAA